MAKASLFFSATLPTNDNKLMPNGVSYLGVHVFVSSRSPVKPIVNGNVVVAICYNAVDASGMMSATTICGIAFL